MATVSSNTNGPLVELENAMKATAPTNTEQLTRQDITSTTLYIAVSAEVKWHEVLFQFTWGAAIEKLLAES